MTMYGEKIIDTMSSAQGIPTAFGSASSALGEARMLASRVTDMVDSLCGPTPTEVMNTANSATSSGSVLSGLREEAERTAEIVRRAQSQLNRLDRELP